MVAADRVLEGPVNPSPGELPVGRREIPTQLEDP